MSTFSMEAFVAELRGYLQEFATFERPLSPDNGTSGCFIEARARECALAIEFWYAEESTTFFVGSEIVVETNPDLQSGEDALRAAIWGAVNGGAGKYKIGSRRYWILGEHARIAAELALSLGRRKVPELIETRCPWSRAGVALLPQAVTYPDSFFLFPI